MRVDRVQGLGFTGFSVRRVHGFRVQALGTRA